MARSARALRQLESVRTRFSRWAKSGVWESLFKTLADDTDNEYAMIDATIVRAHQHSAGARKKGLRPSHRPLARRPDHQDPCDRRRLGQPVGAQPHRRRISTTSPRPEPLRAEVRPKALLGDKGYNADSFIQSLEVRAIKPVIPPKSNRQPRDCDFALYAERNLVERFQFIKQFRGITTATKKLRAISSPACIWSAPSLGSMGTTP